MIHWVLVLTIGANAPARGARLEQDVYDTKAECQDALREAARTNYTTGFYTCEPKEELKRSRKRLKEAKREAKRARKQAAVARKAWKQAGIAAFS